MTLPNAILFPQAMLPLYIFEPRYRQMLRDALDSHRMLSVAMRKPGRVREIPSAIAGLGLIRVSVANKDGTSHLILQGLARVELSRTVRYRPYRVQRMHALPTVGADSVAVDALTAKVVELVTQRLAKTSQVPLHVLKQFGELLDENVRDMGIASLKDLVSYLISINNPDHLADLVSCTLLSSPAERQTILETPNLEVRLKYLVHFLIAENARTRKEKEI